MMQEYYQWLEKHPDATEEEKQKVWDECIRRLEARAALMNMFISLRYS